MNSSEPSESASQYQIPQDAAAIKLQQTIQNTIPLSQHMGYTITDLSEQAINVSAPLENNVNIHGTAFAGSIYAVATLTAWALVYYILQNHKPEATLVLGEGQIKYRTPIKDDLQCHATITANEHQQFINTLAEKGRSRLTVRVNINNAAYWEGKLAAILSGPGTDINKST